MSGEALHHYKLNVFRIVSLAVPEASRDFNETLTGRQPIDKIDDSDKQKEL